MRLEPCEPTGTQRVSGFWDGRDPVTDERTGGVFSEDQPTYDPPPIDVRALMREAGGLRAFAARLGVSAVDACSLMHGRVRPVDGWDALVARVREVTP